MGISWVYRTIVPSWVWNFFSWVFRWSKILSRGYFVGPKRFLEVQDFSYWYLLVKRFFTWVFLLVRIFFSCAVLWVQNFFSCIFYGFKNFPRGYFVGQNFFHVGVLWVRNFMVLVEGKIGAEGRSDGGTSKKIIDAIFITKIMAVLIQLAWSLILILIFIMFDINSSYRADVPKLHYWGFFYKDNLKESKNLLHIISIILW